MLKLKHIVVTLLVVIAVLENVIPAFAHLPTQPDPLVIMDNLEVPEGQAFVYTIVLDNFRFSKFEIRIEMGEFVVRSEAVNVSGVDAFSPDYNASTHVLKIQGYAFEESEGATITIPLDRPIDSDIIVTRLKIGDHTNLHGEVARGHVTVLQSQAQVFLPNVVKGRP